jgi:N-acetylmuramoyl-L-alanine amidase
MPKSSIDTTLNYSPTFDLKKRRLKQIKFIIFHYTGMKKQKDAITKLTNINSKVSSHYFIKNNGEILTLVPDLYIAWHAGVSSWKKYKSINKYSIGIEISNPGHEHYYKKFSKKQINSILKLSTYLIKKYKIKSNFILGHSDIAPDRKKDPGEKFPWKYLSKNKIGFWHNLSKKKLFKERNKQVSQLEKNKFIKNLNKIGYQKNMSFNKNKYSKLLTTAFQRRFRHELVSGIIDQECLFISNNLAKNMK